MIHVMLNGYSRTRAIQSDKKHTAADGSVYGVSGTIWLGPVIGLARYYSSSGQGAFTSISAYLPDGTELCASVQGKGSHSLPHITRIIRVHLLPVLEQSFCAAARGESVERREEAGP